MDFVSGSVFLSFNPTAAMKPCPSSKSNRKLLSFPAAFAARSAQHRVSVVVRSSPPRTPSQIPLAKSLISSAAGALFLTATAAALITGKLHPPTARAEVPASVSTEEQQKSGEAEVGVEHNLESVSEDADSLLSFLHQKLEAKDDTVSLAILQRLIEAQPDNPEWKIVAARLLNKVGEAAESHRIFDEILSLHQFSFEFLFEISVLMDRFGEGDVVIQHLERALELAKSTHEEKLPSDVRLIMAQIKFLQKNIDQALEAYEELALEDPEDYRPYYCQGVIYSSLEKNKDAMEMFSKYRELSPKKFERDAYLQRLLSRTKIGGTDEAQDSNGH